MITVSLSAASPHQRNGTTPLCSGCSRAQLLPVQSQDDELERLQMPSLPVFWDETFEWLITK